VGENAGRGLSIGERGNDRQGEEIRRRPHCAAHEHPILTRKKNSVCRWRGTVHYLSRKSKFRGSFLNWDRIPPKGSWEIASLEEKKKIGRLCFLSGKKKDTCPTGVRKSIGERQMRRRIGREQNRERKEMCQNNPNAEPVVSCKRKKRSVREGSVRYIWSSTNDGGPTREGGMPLPSGGESCARRTSGRGTNQLRATKRWSTSNSEGKKKLQ